MNCCFQQSTSSTENITNRSNRMEARLLAQFFGAFLIYFMTWSCWTWLPYMPSTEWVDFSTTTFYFLNTAANPTVYLIFNSSLRQGVSQLFCRKNSKASVIFVSTRSVEERKI
ncbi:unnamed protein product [Cylicocyclus nassatus]|uniref:G-protein coupled receptors family 1 profile domain-containing protein n=1 Tax=Cylicocyclus nassatus TaxID=53992 RepID=A0AA36GSX1_CYLNA|nr:unnamed protein product [Cylicocyclus nassatus]